MEENEILYELESMNNDSDIGKYFPFKFRNFPRQKEQVLLVWNCLKSDILDLGYFEKRHFQEIWMLDFGGKIQMWSKSL